MLVPGSVVMRAQTSVSGPYWALLRQDVQVVVFVQASVLEVVYRPVSPEPLMPFVQRPASESGFSLARLKLSRWEAARRGRRTRRRSSRSPCSSTCPALGTRPGRVRGTSRTVEAVRPVFAYLVDGVVAISDEVRAARSLAAFDAVERHGDVVGRGPPGEVDLARARRGSAQVLGRGRRLGVGRRAIVRAPKSSRAAGRTAYADADVAGGG